MVEEKESGGAAAAVVEVSRLLKQVDNGGEALTILHEISFAVAAGETVAVVGASGSGKSTLLGRHAPAVVIVALGSNDGLRGLPLATLRENLEAIAGAAQKHKARVLIVGQRLPPNYGPYAATFHAVFGDVARARKTAFVDFLLDGVATQPGLFQSDNLHPTAEAQALLLDNVWRGLAPLLK